MRRALGLGDHPASQPQWHPSDRAGDRHPQRRRFVSDGQVPVVLVGRRDQGAEATPSFAAAAPVNRLAVVETALKAEQEARQRAERLAAEAQVTVHDLRTRLGHAVLTHDEAVAAARQAEADRQALAAALEAERAARTNVEQALQRALSRGERPRVVRRRAVVRPVTDAEPPTTFESQATAEVQMIPARRRGRPPGAKNRVQTPRPAEPKPVKWW